LTEQPRREFRPTVHVRPDRDALGAAAAEDIAAALRTTLRREPGLRMMFAAAPSQESTLRSLATQPDIDWSRVTAFHMDEYVGLPSEAPERFGAWLRRVLFDRVSIGTVNLIEPGDDPEEEITRYARLLAAAPLDLVCCGIGVNGHLAFNDPPAPFEHAAMLSLVELSETSRRQQVDDGCFARLADVPTAAITVTIPALLSAREIYCMVPGRPKRDAVRNTLFGAVSESVPASALRLHPRCTIYLDEESAPRERRAPPEPSSPGSP
jgi:glucosamine-6-phosphate deaminase